MVEGTKYSWLSLETRVLIVVVFSIYQLFLISLHGSYIALALPIAAVLLPEVVSNIPRLAKNPLMWCALFLALVQCVSLKGSVDKQEGLRAIIYSLYFALVLGAALSVDVTNVLRSRGAMALWISLVLLALLVIIFRISPALESFFWHSSVGQIVMNPNVAAGLLDGKGENNVLDPEKSGAFFANGNVAGNYLIMAFFLAIGAIKTHLRACVTAGILLVAVYMTGSKAAILLVNGLIVVAFVCALVKRASKLWRRLLICFLVGIVAGFAIYGPLHVIDNARLLMTPSTLAQSHGQETRQLPSGTVMPGISGQGKPASSSAQAEPSATAADHDEPRLNFSGQLTRTLGSRAIIWGYGIHTLSEHWLWGQGFGGWKQHFSRYVASMPEQHWGVNGGMPPHDTFLLSWSQSGLAGLLICFVLMFLCAQVSLKAMIHPARATDGSLVIASVAAMAALFLQGLGENWGLLGDPHQTVLLALTLTVITQACSRITATSYRTSTTTPS